MATMARAVGLLDPVLRECEYMNVVSGEGHVAEASHCLQPTLRILSLHVACHFRNIFGLAS